MAIKNFFDGGKQISDSTGGAPLSGGLCYFYEPGTTTPKTTYTTSALAVANANPVVLDTGGRANIWLNGNYRVIVKDSTATTTIYDEDNINPTTTSSLTAITTDTTLVLSDSGKFIQASGTITITLTAAATLGSGWYIYIRNNGSNNITITGANTGNTFNGTAFSSSTFTLYPGVALLITVNNAADGFITYSGPGVVDVGGDTSLPGTVTVDDGIGAQYVQNLGFTATVGSNNLTVTLTGKDLAAPSASNVVSIAFRSTTATSGTYTVRKITSATTVTLAGGQTLGFSSSEAGYMYVYLCDDGSTRAIGICKEAIFDETALTNTSAIAAAASATVLYTTSALTSAAVRLIGRISIAPTGSNWANAPVRLDVWTPSMKKTGDVLYRKRTVTATATTGTTVVPYNNNTPQNTDGDQYLTISYTPLNSRNILYIKARLHLANTAGSRLATALFQDSTANALATSVHFQTTASAIIQVDLEHKMTAGTTSATTFNVRAGSDAAGTTTFNGDTGNGKYNGTLNSFIEVIEVQA